jgi:hypothetical protein
MNHEEVRSTSTKLVAQIVAQFRTNPARIMPNCPNQYRCKRLKTFNPISSDTFSRPLVFEGLFAIRF